MRHRIIYVGRACRTRPGLAHAKPCLIIRSRRHVSRQVAGHKPQRLPDEPWTSPLGAAWRASSRERKRRKRRKQGRHSPRPSRQHPSTGSVVLWLCCSPEICAASALVANATTNRKGASLSCTRKSTRTDAQSVRTCSAIPIVCLIAGTLRVGGASTARPSRLDSLPTMDGAASILPMIGRNPAV